jgi:hypothetical protein
MAENSTRRGSLPGGSEMSSEVLTPPESHGANDGARGGVARGSVVIYHGRVEPACENDGPPLGSLHGSTGPLPKDA